MKTRVVVVQGKILSAVRTFSFGCGSCYFRSGVMCTLNKEDTSDLLDCIVDTPYGYEAYHWVESFTEDDRK